MCRTMAWFVVLACGGGVAQEKPKVEPLKNAWESFVLPIDKAAEFRSLTTAQRYNQQMKLIETARKATKNKKYKVRLKVTDVTRFGLQYEIHAEHADEEYRKLFGAQFRIETRDGIAAQLRNGEEFELQGKIIYVVDFKPGDGNLEEPNKLGQPVVHFNEENVGWVRMTYIRMVDWKIVRDVIPADAPRE